MRNAYEPVTVDLRSANTTYQHRPVCKSVYCAIKQQLQYTQRLFPIKDSLATRSLPVSCYSHSRLHVETMLNFYMWGFSGDHSVQFV